MASRRDSVPTPTPPPPSCAVGLQGEAVADPVALLPARGVGGGGGSAHLPPAHPHTDGLHPNISELTINSRGTKFLSVWQAKMYDLACRTTININVSYLNVFC